MNNIFTLGLSLALLFGSALPISRQRATISTDGLTHKYTFEQFLTKNEVSGSIDLKSIGVSLAEIDGHKAAKFENNAYFELPKNMLSGNAVTFDMDIYPTNGTSDWQKLIQINKNQSVYFQINLRPGIEGKMNIQTQLTKNGDQNGIVWGSGAMNSITVNAWNHITVTLDGDYFVIYVNDEMKQEGCTGYTLSEYITNNTINEAYFAKSAWSSDPYFSGYLDNFMVYNRAVTYEEITSSTLPTEDVNLNDHLTAYYSFDNEEEVELDNTDNAYDAINVNCSAVEGKFSKALNLNGGYLKLPNTMIDGEANAFSLSTWVYPTNTANWQKVMDFGTDQQKFFQIMFLSGTTSNKLSMDVALTIDGDTGPTSSHLKNSGGIDAVSLNTWTNLVLTVNGGDVKLYVNGRVMILGNFNNSISKFAEVSAQENNYIGSSHFADPTLKGKLDELAIYNRVLNKTEVAAIAGGALPIKDRNDSSEHGDDEEIHANDGLKYYYPSDGSNNCIDYSGNKGNAIAGQANFVPQNTTKISEELGSYAKFDGNKDFMVLPNNVISKTTGEFSFAAWVRPATTSPDYVRIFDFGEASTYLDFRIRSGGWLEATMTTGSTAGEVKVATSNLVTVNAWQHVALTVSESEVSIYYNGTLYGAGSFGRSPSTQYSDIVPKHTQNYIGLSRFGQDAKYKGCMDEIRVYDRVLNKIEVGALAAGNKYPVENPQIDETVLINGDTKVYETFLLSVGDKLSKHGYSFIVAKDLSKEEIMGQLTLEDGYRMVLVDNYDIEIESNLIIKSGYYLKIYNPENIVVVRYRLFESDAVILTLQNELNSSEVILDKGASYRLPFLVKEGMTFDGWYNGEEKLQGRITVNESMTLIARFN